ncbi:MAG: redoxin domain-containing protein [Bacteroidota bacterium]|jgi:peroxiredoxin
MDNVSADTKHSRIRASLILLLLIVVIPGGTYLYIEKKWIIDPLPLGNTIPSVVLSTVNGVNVRTDSLISMKTVFVFFSISCPHCKRELMYLDSLHSIFKNDIEIIAVSLSSRPETIQFADELKLPFPVYLDTGNEAKLRFRVMPVPALFYFTRHKRLIKYQAGEQRRESLHTTFQQFSSVPDDSLLLAL